MSKITMINVDEGLTLTDSFSDEPFVTKNGVGFLLSGQVVSPDRAMREGFTIDKTFQGPAFTRRTQVTDWLTKTLKIPRGTETYNNLYKHFTSGLPADAY